MPEVRAVHFAVPDFSFEKELERCGIRTWAQWFKYHDRTMKGNLKERIEQMLLRDPGEGLVEAVTRSCGLFAEQPYSVTRKTRPKIPVRQ